MRREPEHLPGVQVVITKVFPDDRGALLQSFMRSDLDARGIPGPFLQAIESRSRLGVVRGLHFQWEPSMGKFLRCIHGAVLDVVVDVRRGSPTLGDHAAVELTSRNHKIIWVPPGFAHGFMALEDDSIVFYECTAEWGPGREGGILWNDPELEIEWPELAPTVSQKDRDLPRLKDWLADSRSLHFRYPA